eukprot:scpid111416/ scgid22851/ 
MHLLCLCNIGPKHIVLICENWSKCGTSLRDISTRQNEGAARLPQLVTSLLTAETTTETCECVHGRGKTAKLSRKRKETICQASQQSPTRHGRACTASSSQECLL